MFNIKVGPGRSISESMIFKFMYFFIPVLESVLTKKLFLSEDSFYVKRLWAGVSCNTKFWSSLHMVYS